jgi:hypothetical protein
METWTTGRGEGGPELPALDESLYAKPGAWVRAVVRCDGHVLTVTMNGHLIYLARPKDKDKLPKARSSSYPGKELGDRTCSPAS